jgi:hypothetical protein
MYDNLKELLNFIVCAIWLDFQCHHHLMHTCNFHFNQFVCLDFFICYIAILTNLYLSLCIIYAILVCLVSSIQASNDPSFVACATLPQSTRHVPEYTNHISKAHIHNAKLYKLYDSDVYINYILHQYR